MSPYCLVLISSFFFAATPSFPLASHNLEEYSSTQFRWWGFKVYKAQIWTPNATRPDFSKSILMHINYQRDIKSKDLVETTLDEWLRLEVITKKEAQPWLKKLGKLWPDIKKGDSLTTWYDGKKTEFYQDKKLLGTIQDKDFGPFFLSIWLHEKSRTAELMIKNK